MKKIISIIVFLFSVISVYSQDRFNNYAISVGYDRINYTYSNGINNLKICSDNVNFNILVYGVYLDCSVSLNTNRYDLYNCRNGCYYRYDIPTVLSMNGGYAFPISPSNMKIQFFVTPMIGFTTLVKNGYRRDYYGYYDMYDFYNLYATKFSFGGSVGVSINKLYLQAKYTNTSIGGSIGYKF